MDKKRSLRINQFFQVFLFTIIQNVKNKKYIRITIGIMFLLLGGCFLGCLFLMYQEDSKNEVTIEKIYLERGFFEKGQFEKELEKPYDKIEFKWFESEKKKVILPKSEEMWVKVEKQKRAYRVRGILSENSTVSEVDARYVLSVAKEQLRKIIRKEAGLNRSQEAMLDKKIAGEIHFVGESKKDLAWTIRMMTPLILGCFVYLILVIYGQGITIEVSKEKSSRLVEMLMVNVYPEALVSGKIVAISLLGMIQIILWISGAVYGLAAGVIFGGVIFSREKEVYREIVEKTMETGIPLNLTQGLLLGILLVGLAILFYSFLAGITGSLIDKPEHAGNVQIMVQLPIMVSFALCYYAIYMEKASLISILKYIPFTAPFILPGQLLLGDCSMTIGWVQVLFMVISIGIIGKILGKVYKYTMWKQ